MPTGQRDDGRTLASDAERELVCTRLQEACVQGRLTMEELSPRLEAALAARTRAELVELVRDLPGSFARPPWEGHPSGPRRGGPPGLPPGSPPKRWHLGLVGSTKRAGRWRIPAETWWASLMGSCRLDLTRAEFEAAVTTINIATWMGSVDVRVPRGYEIRIEGTALMGGKHLRLYGPPPPPGAPVIRLRVLACLGAVKVTDRESIRGRLRQR